jgi:hypothetical protein
MTTHRFVQGFRIGRRLADRALLQARGRRMPPVAALFTQLERGVPRGERLTVRLGIVTFFLVATGLAAALAAAVTTAAGY